MNPLDPARGSDALALIRFQKRRDRSLDFRMRARDQRTVSFREMMERGVMQGDCWLLCLEHLKLSKTYISRSFGEPRAELTKSVGGILWTACP